MIQITGEAKVKARFVVQLDMTEEEFYALPQRKQDELIDDKIDWHNTVRNGETDDIDVWEVDKVVKQDEE